MPDVVAAFNKQWRKTVKTAEVQFCPYCDHARLRPQQFRWGSPQADAFFDRAAHRSPIRGQPFPLHGTTTYEGSPGLLDFLGGLGALRPAVSRPAPAWPLEDHNLAICSARALRRFYSSEPRGISNSRSLRGSQNLPRRRTARFCPNRSASLADASNVVARSSKNFEARWSAEAARGLVAGPWDAVMCRE